MKVQLFVEFMLQNNLKNTSLEYLVNIQLIQKLIIMSR
jgi:hypothetical protein